MNKQTSGGIEPSSLRLFSGQEGRVIENLKGAPIQQSQPPGAGMATSIKPSSVRDISQTAAPFVIEQEIPCEDCGGTGRDIGGLDPWDGGACPRCAGSGRETVIRNYLAEGFQIVANPENTRPVERAHLVAIVQYCRQVVSAVAGLPEVSKRSQTKARRSSSSWLSRGRLQSDEVTQIKRRKRNVAISPQRARS